MSCPYHHLPPTSWWDRAVANRAPESVNPHLPSAFRISRRSRVASAGSCFAQHISNALRQRGYDYMVEERAPSFLSPEKALTYNYGVFSARYGNVYTTLQLLQLVQRALGDFSPREQFWTDGEGRWFDLLRPRITPNGFASRFEAEADCRQHLAAVRRVIESADVFVFTMGLTECWRASVDGTVYPTCPGCGSAGEFDPAKHEFHNLTVAETSVHLSDAVDLIRRLNPSIEIVLTVSPVPLIATMEPRHVLQATTYSKSVLRVAAEELVRQRPRVHYFASYEIITATRNTRAFIEEDGRTIAGGGVGAAMAHFFDSFGEDAPSEETPVAAILNDTPQRATSLVCDEEEFFRAVGRLRSH
jgi:hypothetical protein